MKREQYEAGLNIPVLTFPRNVDDGDGLIVPSTFELDGKPFPWAVLQDGLRIELIPDSIAVLHVQIAVKVPGIGR